MTNVRLTPLSGLLLSIACAPESARQPLPAPSPPSSVASAPAVEISPRVSWSDSIQAVEAAGIRASEGRVTRVGSKLRIQLPDGRIVEFADDSTSGSKSDVHRYAGYEKQIHSHVVHVVPYEGVHGYLVVDDSTGDSTVVFGMPVPSPDAARFVAASMASPQGDEPGLIEIWRMVGRKPEKEFFYSTESESWEPSDPVWRDSVSIEFSKNTRSGCCEPYSKAPGWLIRSGSAWVLANARH
jgi:hypothetical protein